MLKRFFIFLTITTFLAMPQLGLCYNTAALEFVKKHKTLRGTTVADRDLSYANLAGVDLSHARLPGVDLNCADLSSAKFCYADLSGAKIYSADLSGANFEHANLSRAQLGGNLSNAKFCYADLSYATLHGTDSLGANFDDAILYMVKMNHVTIASTSFKRADLSKTEIYIQRLGNVDLSHANLSGSSLYFSNRSGIAKLDSINFQYADLAGCSFSGIPDSYAELKSKGALNVDKVRGLNRPK